jgi:hypothetical protein
MLRLPISPDASSGGERCGLTKEGKHRRDSGAATLRSLPLE